MFYNRKYILDSIPIMEGHFPLNSKPLQLLQSNPRLMDSNKSIEPTGKCLNVYRGMGFYFAENNSDDSIECEYFRGCYMLL